MGFDFFISFLLLYGLLYIYERLLLFNIDSKCKWIWEYLVKNYELSRYEYFNINILM